MGISVKILIQIFPALLVNLAIVFLAASIWLAHTSLVSCATNPKEPKSKLFPLVATRALLGFSLIRCHFLNFTFLGNICFKLKIILQIFLPCKSRPLCLYRHKANGLFLWRNQCRREASEAVSGLF